MDDKIVTHEDLDAIAVIERECGKLAVEGRASDLLRRLRAAAEADQPPLPEGWYWWKAEMATTAVYLIGKILYRWDDGDVYFGTVDGINRDRLTPMRPTVTEGQVEKAARAAREAYHASAGRTALVADWVDAHGWVQEEWLDIARAAFKAAEIEVKGT